MTLFRLTTDYYQLCLQNEQMELTFNKNEDHVNVKNIWHGQFVLVVNGILPCRKNDE
jgi:hypothetical protein